MDWQRYLDGVGENLAIMLTPSHSLVNCGKRPALLEDQRDVGRILDGHDRWRPGGSMRCPKANPLSSRTVYDGMTRNKDRTKKHWGEIWLCETAGAWIAEDVACSDDDGEVDMTQVAESQEATEADRQLQVMDLVAWNHLGGAKASKISLLHMVSVG